jgi:IS5 family transposase
LAEALHWTRFETDLGPLYAEAAGRLGQSARLMMGLHYLKHLFDESGESDEAVGERWVENPYWQHFCSRTYFEREPPLTRPRWSSGAAASVPKASRSYLPRRSRR